MAILGGVAVGRLRSTRTGLLVALLGTLPLVAWFVYDRGESSDRQFLLISLVVPSVSGGLLVAGRLWAQGRPTG
ncbi:MAG TPA: hypothetical protein VGR26_00470 [Acidimicrobiales bacterium]|nr:hypothetical protein [Acidimicrobiales bacterium]